MTYKQRNTKRKNPLVWLMVAFGFAALIFSVMRGCGDTEAISTDASLSKEELSSTAADTDSVDFNLPSTTFSEVNDQGIELKGNDHYSVFTLTEKSLFDTGQSEIKKESIPRLQQISAALKQHFKSSRIVIYGQSDSSSIQTMYRHLGAKRSEAVKEWLTGPGGISPVGVSIHLDAVTDEQSNPSGLIRIVAFVDQKK